MRCAAILTGSIRGGRECSPKSCVFQVAAATQGALARMAVVRQFHGAKPCRLRNSPVTRAASLPLLSERACSAPLQSLAEMPISRILRFKRSPVFCTFFRCLPVYWLAQRGLAAQNSQNSFITQLWSQHAADRVRPCFLLIRHVLTFLAGCSDFYRVMPMGLRDDTGGQATFFRGVS